MRGGSRKTVDPWTYQAGVMAIQPMMSISHTDYLEDEEAFGVDCVLSDQMNVEKEVIKKDLFHNLSVEAKFVVCTIIEAPYEALTEGGKMTLSSIHNYLKKKRWSESTIACIFLELQKFVGNF